MKLGPWVLLPVFVGVNLGALGFGTWAGRGLATYTIYKHLASKELPSTFKYLFVAFSVTSDDNGGLAGAHKGTVQR